MAVEDRTKWAELAVWLAAFVVVPPSVAGGLGKQFVSHHPVLAVVIGVAYEAIVSVGGFFAVIARDVSARWQARIADRVDLFLQRKASRFERQYREFMLADLRFMDHKGLAIVGPFTPELDAVFVDVILVPRPPQQIGKGFLPGLIGERAGRRALSNFLGREKPALLAVVGSPGSGKTTLLRHAARQAWLRKRSRKDRLHHVRDIPILLYLRDHVAAITADPSATVATLLRVTLGPVGVDEPAGWVEQKLRDGQCLVLLDGLDEVARQDDRAKVSAWAERQVRQYPGNDFVISSRPQGYQSAPVEGAEVVQVCGFTASQVGDFVRSWYQAAERHSTGTVGPEADALAAEGTADLLRRLEQAPALYDLAVNPLLLTMIANVHRYRGALPGSRADLYSEICQVMLWRRRDAKRLAQQVSGDKKEAILRSLAYMMMTRRVTDLSRADVLAEVQPALRRVSRGVTSDSFLADAGSDGLFIERETGEYAFAHKTFQEYLTATHIRERGLIGVLADAVSDDWWAETTLLYTAKSDADLIVRACLDDGTAAALALAFDCVGEDSDVDPDLRERLDTIVASAAEPDADPGQRHQISSALLRRHMRQRIRTSRDSHLCPRPMPADIYRLFLADTMTPAPDAPLETPGIAVGMRSSDAHAFIRWANDVSGREQAYRLPLANELKELATQPGIPALPSGQPPSVWIQAEEISTGTRPALWLPPGAPDPHEFSKALHVSAITDDASTSAPAMSGLLIVRARVLIHVLARDVARDLVADVGAVLARDASPAASSDTDLAIDRARGRALNIACALNIARALDAVLTRVLARDVALDLALALELGGAPALALELGGALNAALELSGASALAHARDIALNIGDALDLDIGRVLARGSRTRGHGARARTRTRYRDRDRDLTLDRDLGRVLTLVRDLDRVLADDREFAHALDLATAINGTVDRHVRWKALKDSIPPIFGGIFGLQRAFAVIFTETGGPANGSTARHAQLTAAFTEAPEVMPAEILTADPANLESALQEAVTGLASALEQPTNTPRASSWPAIVAKRLQQSGGSIFARTDQPTTEKATMTRLTALCLASEADSMERKDIGDMFRHVATGITLLEHRATGRLSASEVIMLAVERPPFDAAVPPDHDSTDLSRT